MTAKDFQDFDYVLAMDEQNLRALQRIAPPDGAHKLKMPQLAHAVRVLVCGRAQTPSIDAVLELFPREAALERLLRR